MFCFGEVRTHLGVVFSGAFGIFEGFSWIYGKIEEIRKIWAMSRVLRQDVGTPRRSEGPLHDVASPRHSVAELEPGQASGTPGVAELRRSLATVHSMENVMFCFVLLFRY